MVNLSSLEAQRAQAEKEKEENIVKEQIKVYEGQTYEARDTYAEAKAKRGKSRAKLPEKIPEDKAYKEQLLQAQYAKMEAISQSQSDQVDEYTTEIKIQQEAKETTRILDEQMPALLYKAEQEVESVKEAVYVTAKETATKKQDEAIQVFTTQIETEKQRRADEIKEIKDRYSAMKNPYPYRKASAGRSFNNDSHINWNKSVASSHKAELDAVRMKNIKADGFQPASVNRGGFIPMPSHPTARKLYTGEAINQHTLQALKSGASASSIDNRWTRYQVEISRANQAVYEGGSLSAHASAVARAKATFDGLELKEQKSNSAKARAESVNQLAQDQKHWNQVISNPSTSGASQTAITALGLSHNVNELNASGVSSIYNVGDMTKAGFLPTSATVTLNTSSPYKKVGDTIPTRTNTSSDSKTNESNIIQKQYTKDLRTGKVGLADALLTQRTAGGYTGANTVNLKTFLAERGYNLSRPETIPDSVFKPVKYDKARKQATHAYKTDTEMGDLRNLIPPIQEVSSSTLQTRQKANAERAGIVGTVSKQADMSFAKDKMMSGGAITIQKNASSTNLVSGGKFDPFNADPIRAQETKGYTWTVSIPNREKIPTMSGGVFEANAPPTEYTFDSEKEAKLFAKSSQPKVFSGTDNEMFNRWNYPSAVDTGEVIHPSKTKTLYDDVRLGFGYVFRPTYNIGATVYNLAQPENKQVPIFTTAEDKLIGGTITDVMEGQPLRGTGVTSFTDYVVENPFRAVAEIPSAVVTGVVGGKAVSLGVKGIGAGKTMLANANYIPQVVKNVGTKIQSGAEYVQAVPKRTGVAVGSQVWKITPTQVRAGLQSVDKSLAYVGGQRVGLTTAMNLRYTLGGRKFLKESLATSSKENAMPKKTAQQFIDDPLTSVNKKENPINIVSKNVIEVPIKKSDESIIHTRNIDFNAPAVKVGNVQQYYKSATPSFVNVPRQGLQFPKAPKLPSLDSARRWVAKTKSNVNLVEQKGYGAMLSGGNVKIKAVEKGMKAKDNILDAKQIARDEINFAKEDLSILIKQKKMRFSDDSKQMKSEVTESVKKTLVDPTSKAKRTDNAWNKLSQIKTETRVKMGEMKKSITDRPATDELILYRETTETTATKSIARSTTEPLTVSATPIKTSITQTKTPTDFTTKKVSKQFVEGEETLYPKGWKQAVPPKKPELVYENVEGSLFKLNKVDPNLQIIGEQVRIPFKDHKTIQSLDQANLDRMYQQGKYNVLEKGKLVEKKVEVKALQQEDVDKTFQQRNSQMTTVSTWGGVKSDTSFRYAINNKVLTTKLSPLPKKDMPKVIDKRMTQNDRTSQWTGSSVSGNPMTGKGRSNTSTIDETGTYDPRTGTTTIPKINAVSSPVKGKAKLVMKDYSSTLKSAKSPYNSAYTGGAIGEVTFTSSILTPKNMIKTGVDTNSASITGVQSKISTATETQSAQKLSTDTVSKLNTRSGLRSKMSIKLDTGLKQKQMTTTAQVPLLKTPVTRQTRTPKPLPIILPRIELMDKPAKRGKRGKKAGFIGNVRLDNVMGMYKRKEITYGQSKVTKLERQDARLTSGTSNRISMPSSSLLTKKKKKTKKSVSVFGGGKDEFKGFVTKTVKKKKKKGKKKKSTTKRLL